MPSEPSTELSPLFAARMAGALWLIVIVVSIVAVLGGTSIEARGDPGAIAANALASASRMRLTFAMLFLGKICYLGATVLIYELLKPVNKSIALFGAFCGLAGLLSRVDPVQGFSGEDVFFGFQTVAIGYLILRSLFVPRAIGALMVLGGVAFLFTAFTNFLAPSLGARLAPLLLPVAGLAEALLAIWLVARGIDVERWRFAMARTTALNAYAR